MHEHIILVCSTIMFIISIQPLVDLCLFGKGYKQEDAANDNNVQHDSTDTKQETDFVMKTIVGRRFGIYTDANVMKILHDPNEVVVLVFPHKQAMDLEEGIRLAEERCGYNTGCKESSNLKDTSDIEEHYINKKMTLIFIDATWKHAREMESASAVEWPKDLIRVQLKPSESTVISGGSAQSHHDDSANDKTKTEASSNDERLTFIERRFQIRAPPSPDHLSTAECLAWIASRVEHNPHIYQSILKTLDYMVNIWKDITEQSAAADSNNRKKRKKGKPMSQKKLKISKS